MSIITIILTYKMSGNPVKNQRKKPRRNFPCNENRKRRYITRGDVFLPELNLLREDQCAQWLLFMWID